MQYKYKVASAAIIYSFFKVDDLINTVLYILFLFKAKHSKVFNFDVFGSFFVVAIFIEVMNNMFVFFENECSLSVFDID